jgi:hypothetical protein
MRSELIIYLIKHNLPFSHLKKLNTFIFHQKRKKNKNLFWKIYKCYHSFSIRHFEWLMSAIIEWFLNTPSLLYTLDYKLYWKFFTYKFSFIEKHQNVIKPRKSSCASPPKATLKRMQIYYEISCPITFSPAWFNQNTRGIHFNLKWKFFMKREHLAIRKIIYSR